MTDVNRRAALSFVRFVSVSEFIALASLVVAWIYFFSDSSRSIIFLTLLHGFAIFTSTTGFFLVRWGTRASVQVYVGVQGLNLVASAIAIALFATISSGCESNDFCSSGPFGRKLTTYFVILATWMTASSLIGLAGAMIALGYIPKGEGILPNVKQTKEAVRQTYRAITK